MLLPGIPSYQLPPQVQALTNPADTYLGGTNVRGSGSEPPRPNLMYNVAQQQAPATPGTPQQAGSEVPGTQQTPGVQQSNPAMGPGMLPANAQQFAAGVQQGMGPDGLRPYPTTTAGPRNAMPPQVAALASGSGLGSVQQYGAPVTPGTQQQVPPQVQALAGGLVPQPQGGTGNGGFWRPSPLGMPQGLPGFPGGSDGVPQSAQDIIPVSPHTSGLAQNGVAMNTANGLYYRNR